MPQRVRHWEAVLVEAGERVAGTSDPSVEIGSVSESEFLVQVAQATAAPTLPDGWRALGSPYEINATSLSTGDSIHRLGETATVRFELPAGISQVDAAAAAIYHWDPASASWEPGSFASTANGWTHSPRRR